MQNQFNPFGTAGFSSGGASEEGGLFYRLYTTVLLYVLLAEWLLPWLDTGWAAVYGLKPLLVAVGCVLLAGVFRPSWPVAMALNGLICLSALMWLFRAEGEGVPVWFVRFVRALWEQLTGFPAFGLAAASGELRTLLLFIGFAMLAPALQSLIWLRQLALGLAALTAGYLLLLHAFTGMDVLAGIARTAAAGLLLAAASCLPRVRRFQGDVTEPEAAGRRGRFGWLATSISLAAGAVCAGLLLSHGRPPVERPAAWAASLTERVEQSVRSWSDRSGETALQAAAKAVGATTGYGFDDTELGGPLRKDDTVVFKGQSPVRAYWRGEAKAVYDGRGWSNDWSASTLLQVEDGSRDASLGEGEGAAMGREIVRTVTMRQPAEGWPLFSAGAEGSVTELIGEEPEGKQDTYVRDDASGALYPFSRQVKVKSYTVRSVLPFTDAEKLRGLGIYSGEAAASYAPAGIASQEPGAGSEPLEGNGAFGPASGANRGAGSEAGEGSAEQTAAAPDGRTPAEEGSLDAYLQLPESLPSRVKALASEVAGGGMTNRYDQAKAVESFLRNSYRYTLENSKQPPAGADFVDDFLFEQRQGYCVHFSSAMVVMLRSIGIPARWVKGFAPGTLEEDGAGGESLVRSAGGEAEAAGASAATYVVRAQDAHAWVEVFFPGAGWVPFEPTPGFAGFDETGAAASAAAQGGASGEDSAAWQDQATAPDTGAEHAAALFARAEAAVAAAAEQALRGAAALAQAARSAAAGAAEATPAAWAAAGGAALALSAAVWAAAQRGRLRLALALRRYGSAYAALSASAASAGGAAAPAEAAGEPPAGGSRRQAASGGRSRLPRVRRPTQAGLHKRYASVSTALWPQLHRRFKGQPANRTSREFAEALSPGLAPTRAEALRKFVDWDNAARFDRKESWQAPNPSELAAVVKALTTD